jgi:ComF family protein
VEADSQPGSAIARGAASLLQTAAQGLFATLFPADCRLCGAPLENISRLPVCSVCLDAMPRMTAPVCSVCGERISEVAAGDDERCGLCRRVEMPFVKAAAYGPYEAGVRELLLLFKYGGVQPAASVLGHMLGEVLLRLSEDFREPPLVVVVPLHVARQRQRGFNQAELIARAALKNFRVGTGVELQLATGDLLRIRETASQTGLTRHQRRANMRGAFSIARPATVRGRDIVLIDDVFTTGATVAECARVLRRAGAARVLVATVARVLTPEVARVLPNVNEVQEVAPLRARAAHA